VNIIAVAFPLTASFLIVLTAGIFTQTGFSDVGISGGRCYIEKFLPSSALPYQRQVVCQKEITYQNGTTIIVERTTYWCYGGTIYGGAASGTCIVYQPGGKETATTTGNPLASEPINNESSQPKQLIPTEPESGSKSTDNNQPKQLLPTEPESGSKSTDNNQPKQLLPIEPKEDTKTDKGVSGDSNENNEEIGSADK
jgi:hypothetical protein